MKSLFIPILAILIPATGFAQVQPAKIFSDSMVLQRGIKIPVWGWAGAGEKIKIHFHQQLKTAVAASDGKWKISLDPEKEGGPFLLTISGSNQVQIKDVLVGDVWICSGQSNMEMTVKNSNNAVVEVSSANNNMIRHVKIPNTIGDRPHADLLKNTQWKTAVAANVGDFTAVGYFFAKELYAKLKVPIGLINTSWGGTHVETWTSREAFENSEEFKEMIGKIPALNLDSLSKIQKDKMMVAINKLQGGMAKPEIINTWSETNFNDSKWPQMKVPGLWEEQSLSNIDGVVWFRKTILISEADAGKSAEISLGMIDDNDDTYLNGVKIGSTNGYNINRVYHVAAGILKAGNNVLAIRVDDTGGGGGLYSEPSAIYISINNQKQLLAGNWQFQVASLVNNSAVGPNSYPTLLFNAMINPLIPFGIKGAIWYQGESNADRAYQYRKAFPLMITDWRKRWGQGNFPFYFVQLASFNSANGNSERGSKWAELREAQTMTLSLQNTGMAVSTDIGESKDIHPKNKQDVGKRLAAVAMQNAYGKTNLVYSGPIFRSVKMDGNKALISFSSIGSGLYCKSGTLQGFEIAGADQKFYPATGVIKGDLVMISSGTVLQPIAVRYAWADDAPQANLFNKEGFPAGPFRTDLWKEITESVKFSIQ